MKKILMLLIGISMNVSFAFSQTLEDLLWLQLLYNASQTNESPRRSKPKPKPIQLLDFLNHVSRFNDDPMDFFDDYEGGWSGASASIEDTLKTITNNNYINLLDGKNSLGSSIEIQVMRSHYPRAMAGIRCIMFEMDDPKSGDRFDLCTWLNDKSIPYMKLGRNIVLLKMNGNYLPVLIHKPIPGVFFADSEETIEKTRFQEFYFLPNYTFLKYPTIYSSSMYDKEDSYIKDDELDDRFDFRSDDSRFTALSYECSVSNVSFPEGEYFSIRYRLQQMLRDYMNDKDKDDMIVAMSEIDRIYF